MKPILIIFGKFILPLHYVLFFVTFFVLVIGIYRLGKKYSIRLIDSFFYSMIIITSALFFARVFYIMLHIQESKGIPSLYPKGLTSYGALFGGILAIWYISKESKLSFWTIADIVGPLSILSYSICRIGCFLSGCCRGIKTDLPWSVVFPLSKEHSEYISVHPVQLYDSYLNFLLFLFLLEYKKKFEGELFLLFLIGNSLIRFFVEYFRWGVSAKVVYGFITQAQIVSIGIIFTSLISWKILKSSQLSSARS